MNKEPWQYVDQERLRKDIETAAQFGSLEEYEYGRTVLTGTDANKKAREYLVERLDDAGLSVHVDAVGNISGRWEPANFELDSTVATGSHLDSVPEGGVFDGLLGVFAALEAVRAISSSSVEPKKPIEVVAFTEEEGARFSEGVLGSSVASGVYSAEQALQMTGDRGIKLKDSLERIGFQGEDSLDASTWDSWLELHIEQGTQLEESDSVVGVVNSINGTKRCFIEISGRANHAGTTAMDTRTDALAAASEIILHVESLVNEIVEKKTETAVGTVGTIDIEPGAINVIPGSVELGIDIRANEKAAINSIIDSVRTELKQLEEDRGVATNISIPYNVDPVNMDKNCVRALQNGAQTAGYGMTEMHSGAGHDTMVIATVTDCAMLFVESRDGISHNPEEWTDWENCAVATQVLTGGLACLATKDEN